METVRSAGAGPGRPSCGHVDGSSLNDLFYAYGQHGCERCFEKAAERLYPKVLYYMLRLVRNDADAEDITQEVFLRLHRAREAYDGKRDLLKWVFHIACNYHRNWVRDRGRRRVLAEGDLESRSEVREVRRWERADDAPSPALAAEHAEFMAALRDAFGELREVQRTSFRLSVIDGLRFDEVAEEMGMRVGQVKNQSYRARGQLRRSLERFDPAA